MNLIINTIPDEPKFTKKPEISDRVAYGKYLITAASCSDCHTPIDNKGTPLEGMQFAGGMEFKLPTGGAVYSANITPHQSSGIGSWSEEMFIARFKQFQDSSLIINNNMVEPGEFNTEMPWRFYSKMSEEELGSIFEYLKSIDPIDHSMTRFIAESK